MEWLLILTLLGPSGPVDLRAGVMVDARLCVIAGAGSAAILEAATPGVVVAWRCEPMVAV